MEVSDFELSGDVCLEDVPDSKLEYDLAEISGKNFKNTRKNLEVGTFELSTEETE